MSRIDTPEHERNDFYLYVDEFQNFATESFANILSEARKYRLNLIIAHQYIEQLDEKVQAGVFGNVGTIVCFRVGAIDAEVLVKEFAPYVTEEDLVNLAKWQIYLKLMIDGVASTPFSANTLAPVSDNCGNREKVIRVTRERYAQKREIIEDKISRWAGGLEQASVEEHRLLSALPPRNQRLAGQPLLPLSTALRPAVGVVKPTSPATPSSSQVRSRTGELRVSATMSRSESTTFKPSRLEPETMQREVTCDACGKSTTVSFTPDTSRAIYCRECLRKVKLGQIPKITKAAKASAQLSGASTLQASIVANTPSVPVVTPPNSPRPDSAASSGSDVRPSPLPEVPVRPGETVVF